MENIGLLGYQSSVEANTIDKANLRTKELVKYFLLGAVTYRQLIIKMREVKVDPRYQTAFGKWQAQYLTAYLALLGFNITMIRRAGNRTFPSIFEAKYPSFAEGAVDAGQLEQRFKQRLAEATNRMIQKPIPNRLYSEAEVDALRSRQFDQLYNLRESGTNLIMISSHADCSELCEEWQGKVYSLNHTSGTAPDGRQYVPIEEALGPTKVGHRYCKHTFHPYISGQNAPHVSSDTLQREREITAGQRKLERSARYYEDRYTMYKFIDNSKAEVANRKRELVVEKYYEYCGQNGRTPLEYRIQLN